MKHLKHIFFQQPTQDEKDSSKAAPLGNTLLAILEKHKAAQSAKPETKKPAKPEATKSGKVDTQKMTEMMSIYAGQGGKQRVFVTWFLSFKVDRLQNLIS